MIVVLGILAVLAAVVAFNVVGIASRGEVESYAVDERTIQLVVSTFYADNHAYSATDGGWNEAGNYTSVHNYPTRDGQTSTLYLGNETDMGKYKVRVVMDGTDNTPANEDIDGDITAAAIWMGLLVNGPGDSTADTRGGSAPLAGEPGPYLNSLPKSCSPHNSAQGSGTYTWIVGAYGRIYGVFEDGGFWYAGYGGRYP
jgi:type II secretory pathway pseudopilin PulG